MLWRILTSLGVWAIIWIALALIGTALISAGSVSIGTFLVGSASIIGFLFGLMYFFFGSGYYGGPGTGWTRRDRP